ncbi:DUF6443 domain-containing protein [Pseudochryseolinea flava]|uniref:DUF6443 domain-containing protein n=1 Tax=Pseudochryseolinea flava TaxID=2059302 RepID=A0A364Y1I8_9BACT|nr:DUF6443 domain-containing protein [Pseudochryseolinea flava]RAW00574.1 hypothetical protein DQQ10_13320 [Pseudochryseolinea flava]
MVKRILLYIILAVSIQLANAQDFSTVHAVALAGVGKQSSYVVNSSGLLRPGFSLKASAHGSFFISANKTANGVASPDKNSIRTETLQKKMTTEALVTAALHPDKIVSYEYFDGIGRSLQSVDVKQSPASRDVVNFKQYDKFGRQPKSYLPYTGESNSQFRSSPEEEQKVFYNGTVGIPSDSEPYSLNYFHESQLNIESKTYAPGWSWHNDANSKPTTQITRFNVADEVLFWSTSSLPSANTFYPPGALLLTEHVLPNGKTIIKAKDELGRLIMEKEGAEKLWRVTYFIYDFGGNLKLVFPPLAVEKLSEYNSSTNKIDFLNRWCFQYEHDHLNRITGKKIPGADWIYTIFDRWDRQVLVQDGEQRLKNEWTYTKYDCHNRVIITGITTGLRSQLTTKLANASVRFEVNGNNEIGYSNTALPLHSLPDILTIQYYDSYDFLGFTNWEDNGNSSNYKFQAETAYPKVNDVHQLPYPAAWRNPPKGFSTGYKVKIIGADTWLNGVTYYDSKGRILQKVGQNHLGTIDRVTTLYDFTGNVLKELQRHGSNIVIQKEYSRDHTGRLLNVYHQVGDNPSVILSNFKYNELGKVIEKNLHSTDNGKTYLQSIDYRYNIQGWLSSINNVSFNADGSNNDDVNDLFGMEINYDKSLVVNGTASTKNFHGNISAIKWNTNNLVDPPKQKAYAFTYDVFDRLKSARYATLNGANWNGNPNMFNEIMEYDINGNISTLKRYGKVNGAVANIDDLLYQYASVTQSKSNALRHVVDKSTYWSGESSFGYTEKPITHSNFVSDVEGENNTEYEYYLDGNLKSDLNKEIVLIEYNHLDYPTKIQLSGNRVVEYQYDATGNKLRTLSKETSPTKILEQIDYVGAIQYWDGKLASIETTEGRVVRGPTGYEYEYYIRDHQQNVRVVFGSGGKSQNYLATMEAVRATKEAQSFKGIAGDATYNHTSRSAEIVAPIRASKLNSAVSGGRAVGPSIQLNVQGGDNIQSHVYGRYSAAITGTNTLVANITSLVTTALGLTPTGENAALFNAVNDYLPAQAASVPKANSYPKAYLCYILVEKVGEVYHARQFGYACISDLALSAWQKLALDVHVPESIGDGVVFIYVANESKVNAATNVFFDDLAVVHQSTTPTLQVYQSSDYYPFGLSFNQTELSRNYYHSGDASVEDVQEGRVKFQGQELQEQFDLGWYHYKYRMHDPALGRFSALDPLAEDYKYNSVYAFSENRLIDGIELEGAEFWGVNLWQPFIYPQMDADLSGLNIDPVPPAGPEFTFGNLLYSHLAFAQNVSINVWNGTVGTMDFLLSPKDYIPTLMGLGTGINNYLTEPDFLGRNYDLGKNFLADPHAADKIGSFALGYFLPKLNLAAPKFSLRSSQVAEYSLRGNVDNFPNGSFSVSDWTGYPSGAIRPSGPFRLLEGAEYSSARKLANSTNAALHKANNELLRGLQIHEIHPVKFGGSPTDLSNKIFLTPAQHLQYTNFWNSLMRTTR